MPWRCRSLLAVTVLIVFLIRAANGAIPCQVSFEFEEYQFQENGEMAVISLIRAGDSNRVVSVNFSFVAGGNAVAGHDFLPFNGRLFFAAGETRIRFLIGLLDNFTPEESKFAMMAISDPQGGATLGSTNSARLLIEENDSLFRFAVDSIAVNESGTVAALPVSRTFGTNVTNSIGYFVSGVSAIPGMDFVPTSGSLVFMPGETNRTIDLQIIDDELIEAPESFQVHLTNAGAIGSFLEAPSNVTVRIIDNDFAPGVITFSQTNFNVFENADFAAVTLIRTNGISGLVSVGFRTTGAATLNPPPSAVATPNFDFTLTNGVVSFADGETNKVIRLEILDDRILEFSNEIFLVQLTASGGGALIGRSNATVNIVEDDFPGVVQFLTNQIFVSESAGQVSIPVVRLGDSAGSISVDYHTSTNVGLMNVAATEGIDYAPAAGTLIFGHGETNKSLSITLFDDSHLELSQDSFAVRLTNPVVGGLGFLTTNLVHIQDDDVVFEFVSEHFSVFEGDANAIVSVQRIGNPNTTASVDLIATNGIQPTVTTFQTNLVITNNIVIGTNITPIVVADTNSIPAIVGDHFTGLSTRIHFAPGVLFTNVPIPILDDRLVQFDRSIAVRLANPSSGAELGIRSNATATIVENDSAFALRIGPADSANGVANEPDSAILLLVAEVIRYGNNTGAVSVAVRTIDITAVGGLDFRPPPGTVIFTNGQERITVVFEILGDSIAEGDETFAFELVHANPTNTASIGTDDVFIPVSATNTSGQVTIIDNEVMYQFVTNSMVVDESLGVANVEVIRRGAISTPGTVVVAAVNGTAIGDSDFTLSPQLLSFGAGQSNQVIAVPIVQDELAEPTEFFQLALYSPVTTFPHINPVVGSNRNAVVSIRDSVGRIEMQLSSVLVDESASNFFVTISRVGGAGGAVSAVLEISDGTASSGTTTNGADYARADVVPFFWNDFEASSRTNLISIYDDLRHEPDETFHLTLRSFYPTATNVTNRSIVIWDNDGRASIDRDYLQPEPGFDDTVYALAKQPNGQVIVGGAFLAYDNIYRAGVARLNPDGTLDPTFNHGAGLNEVVFSAAVQADGGVLVGGDFTAVIPNAINRLARFLPTGEFDLQFDIEAGADARVNAIVPLQDGGILVGGEFSRFGASSAAGLVRLHAIGRADASFGTAAGVAGHVHAICVYPTLSPHAGKILIGGLFDRYGEAPVNNLARLHENGSLDTSFVPGTGPDGVVHAIALEANDRIIIGGAFAEVNGVARANLARLESDGGLEPTLEPHLNGFVTAVAVDPLGGFLAGGKFTCNSNQIVNRIVRFDTAGNLDPHFVGPRRGASGIVNALLLTADDRLLFGGGFLEVNGKSHSRIARYNGVAPIETDLQLSVTASSAGAARFHLKTDPGRVLRLQESTNLKDWFDWDILDTEHGEISYSRSFITQPTNNFYRAVLIDE